MYLSPNPNWSTQERFEERVVFIDGKNLKLNGGIKSHFFNK